MFLILVTKLPNFSGNFFAKKYNTVKTTRTTKTTVKVAKASIPPVSSKVLIGGASQTAPLIASLGKAFSSTVSLTAFTIISALGGIGTQKVKSSVNSYAAQK